MKRFLLLILLLIISTLLLGCATQLDRSTSVKSCGGKDDCATGESCIDNICKVVGDHCSNSNPCSAGYQCDEYGACVSLCEGITCSGHGICEVNNGKADCNCDRGYRPGKAPFSCEDKCLGVACDSHGICSHDGGTGDAICICDFGYGDTEHPDRCIDWCDGMSCSDHGSCRKNSQGAYCACDYGYHPEELNCLKDGDPCEGVTCSGHGICYVSGDQTRCNCDLGYYADGINCLGGVGSHCEQSSDCSGDTPFCSVLSKELGYCSTLSCGEDGAACLDNGLCYSDFCYRRCTPGDDDSCNDSELVCGTIGDNWGACIGRCYSDDDCSTDFVCGETGQCDYNYLTCSRVTDEGCPEDKKCISFSGGAQTCLTPGTAQNGESCTYTEDCDQGLFCLTSGICALACDETALTCGDKSCFIFSDGDGGYCYSRRVEGDQCDDALYIGYSVTIAGSTVDATDHYSYYVGESGNDLVYGIALEPSETLTATVTHSTGDAVIYLVENCSEMASLAFGDEQGSSGGEESLTYNNSGSSQKYYYLIIDGYDVTDNFPFRLKIIIN